MYFWRQALGPKIREKVKKWGNFSMKHPVPQKLKKSVFQYAETIFSETNL